MHKYTSNQQLLNVYKIVADKQFSKQMRDEGGCVLSSLIIMESNYFPSRKIIKASLSFNEMELQNKVQRYNYTIT